MTDTDPVELLVREVDDYLDLSGVGLYEFLWILRGERVAGTRDQYVTYAQSALRTLLAGGRGRLVLLVWPREEVVQVLDREVEPRDFDDPRAETPYVAIIRN